MLSSPISLYGLCDRENFIRFDTKIAKSISDYMEWLSYCTAGVRARFSTDSPFIKLYAELRYDAALQHMTGIGVSGFDLYRDGDNKSDFVYAYRQSGINEPAIGDANVTTMYISYQEKLFLKEITPMTVRLTAHTPPISAFGEWRKKYMQ